jgi:tetratricopeptide (TPR) repeat protein
MTAGSARNRQHHFAHPLLRACDWQDRPEFARLCDWWRQIGKGVCALVGIGGAGKTAVVDRFLRVLPEVLPPDLGVRKLEALPTPRRLFVFSFYDAPNPDAFFTQLVGWLTERMNRLQTTMPSYEQTVRLLEYAGPCLMVLDGLEKVQEDGLRGAPFGQIADGRLRSFVLRAAEGRLGEAALLITTRFALEDLRDHPGLNYREIAIDHLSEEACIALLRLRGVRGTDSELVQIARDCGLHALTVDLAGGYVTNFADGRCAANWAGKGTSPEQAMPATNDRLQAVALQSARFERLARRYRDALAQTDPAALAILERVCLFRLGVDADLLALIFTGPDKDDLSGPHLAALSLAQLRTRLDKLVAMHLLEATQRGAPTREEQQGARAAPTVFSGVTGATYTIHPAVRDGFLSGLSPESVRRGHEAASQGLVVSLEGLPGRDAHLSNPQTLDLLEEIVYHTLGGGRADTAWEMYLYLIGGYENLGRRLGAYERGERICRAFVDGQFADAVPSPAGLSNRKHAFFLNEWALYLSDLGRLRGAARCYERNIALRLEEGSWKNASIGNQNLTDLLLAAGNLREGLAAAEEAVRLAERAAYAFEHKDAHAYRGYARALRGETAAAQADFEVALWRQRQEDRENARPLYRLRGIQQAWLLARLGRHEEAARLTETNKEILRLTLGEQHHYLPRCDLLLAGLARTRGDLPAARELQHQAQEWALARDAREVLCWSALEAGSIALAEARRKADGPFGPQTTRYLNEARHAAEEGLRTARDCGFGVFHIDLLLLRASIALDEGQATSAECDCRTALETGFRPPTESGESHLLPASDPDCGYAWGEGLARHLLAESLLLQAAQQLGRARLSPEPPRGAICQLLENAESQLARCRTLRTQIGDPALADTERILRDLADGVLTPYPLRPHHST